MTRKCHARFVGGLSEKESQDHLAGFLPNVRDVKLAYWEVARAQSLVELNKENVSATESLLTAVRRQVDVGTAPGSQAIKAEVELARAKQELLKAEAELDSAKSVLNTLLGRNPNTRFTVTDRLTPRPLIFDSAELEALAVTNRPEIAEAVATLTARRADVDAVKAQSRPDIAIQARKETFGGDGGVGLGISLPLVDWGSRKAEKSQAEALVSAQEKRIEAEKDKVKLEVRHAVLAVEAANALVMQYETGILAKSEQLAQMAEKGYKAGAASYLEVLEAQRTLRAVKAEYIDALAGQSKATAELEWTVGGKLTDEEEVK